MEWECLNVMSDNCNFKYSNSTGWVTSTEWTHKSIRQIALGSQERLWIWFSTTNLLKLRTRGHWHLTLRSCMTLCVDDPLKSIRKPSQPSHDFQKTIAKFTQLIKNLSSSSVWLKTVRECCPNLPELHNSLTRRIWWSRAKNEEINDANSWR